MLIGCLKDFPLNTVVTFSGVGLYKVLGSEDTKILLQYTLNPNCIVRASPDRIAINGTLKIE